MNQGRKVSGGKYHAERKQRKHEIMRQERQVVLGEVKKKKKRVRGGLIKTVLLRSNYANVSDSKGIIKKAEIKNVLETPSNPFLARQNRLIKGAIIETNIGKAKITNRPTREGNVNAILVAE